MDKIKKKPTDNASLADNVFGDGEAQSNLAEERMFLVVGDQVDQTFELRRADDEQPSFLLDPAVFDLILRSAATKNSIINHIRKTALKLLWNCSETALKLLWKKYGKR